MKCRQPSDIDPSISYRLFLFRMAGGTDPRHERAGVEYTLDSPQSIVGPQTDESTLNKLEILESERFFQFGLQGLYSLQSTVHTLQSFVRRRLYVQRHQVQRLTHNLCCSCTFTITHVHGALVKKQFMLQSICHDILSYEFGLEE